MHSAHVREVVSSSRQGGASLNILSVLVAGNFSAYWLGLAMLVLMATAYGVSTAGLGPLMAAPAGFAFRPLAFGFLGVGPGSLPGGSYRALTRKPPAGFRASPLQEPSRLKGG